jgi:hypothetical protein
MLIDLDKNSYIEGKVYDTCIIGAGVAGITIANELINSTNNICIVESGSFSFESQTQELYKGDITVDSAPHANLDTYRVRYFGGTSNAWGGAVLPYSQIDFKKRSYIPKSGWPIERRDLKPFYDKAMTYYKVGDNIDDYKVNYGEVIEGLERSKKLETGFMKRAKRSTIRFSEVYKDKLIRSIDVYINSNVTNLNPDLSEDRIEIKTLNGKRHYIKSKKIVICTGGIESARLLLLSSKNYGNNVGRYYSPHWNSHHGLLIVNKNKKVLNKYTNEKGGDSIKRYLTINEGVMHKRHLLNAKITLEGLNTKDDLIDSVAKYFDETIFSSANKRFLDDRNHNIFEFDCATEQTPNYNSRVFLGEKIDKLGQPKLILNYLVSNQDKKSLLDTYKIIGQEMGRLNLGRIMFNNNFDLNAFEKTSEGASHHTGTTRMANSSDEGVVDRDLKIFGTKNMYICSSSIFPTSGHANTTLTITAFAIRLANKLKSSV